ncbi:MAG: protease inhibitor I42 family protein [Candidatus Omnitrophica bacterium]|nr:protease inhibitor I42 family protein [Candidatus Omnitrophota bacterium]
MRISIILVFLAIYSFAFGETYVDSKAEVRIPFGQEEQDAVNTIQAYVGKDFIIVLDANATTGYSWELADPIDEGQIKLVGSEYVTANTGLVGAGGKSVWTFKALKVAKAKISFKYVRPWEKDVAPAKVSTFVVDIRNKK